MQKNDISMLMNFENKSINPIEYAQLIKCQATTCGFERSFSMQNKMMQKDRIFLPENVKINQCCFIKNFDSIFKVKKIIYKVKIYKIWLKIG